jgi:hypothetical protein
MFVCIRLLGVFLLLGLSGCQPAPPKVFDQQLYIWQRQWRPAHAEALAQSRGDFSTLRLDGQLLQLDSAAIGQQIQQLLSDWQSAGLTLSGVEIDHDCATARLPAYTELLRTLRQQLPAQLKLSITALPAWLASPELEKLLASVDSSVLQVHAVSKPSLGLFAPQAAQQWARAYGQRSPKAFYLALPAYGVALLDSPSGVPLVESEAPLASQTPLHELQADPEQVAVLIKALQQAPPPQLAGLIWFRLPLAGDRRAWPMATLQAVARGQPLRAKLQLRIKQSGALSEVSLHNNGNLSIALPERLEISAEHCDSADGIGGYRLQDSRSSLLWLRQRPAQLAAGQQLAIGWARCANLNQGVLSANL